MATAKDEGSLLKGFALAFVIAGAGSGASARTLWSVTDGRPLASGPKAFAILALAAPLLFIGQRALKAYSGSRPQEARGLVLGSVSGAVGGLFLAFVLAMAKARVL